MAIPRIFLRSFLFVLVSFISSSESLAEPKTDQQQPTEDSSCIFYRPKKTGIPVYDEPDTSSRVLKRLKLGERVCYVGEQKGFAILKWQPSVEGQLEKKDPGLAFARLVDLWEPRSSGPRHPPGVAGLWSRLKSYYQYMRSGGVPEDVMTPYEPVTGIFRNDSEEVEDEEDEEAIAE